VSIHLLIIIYNKLEVNNMSFRLYFPAFVFFFGLTGCATIFDGDTQLLTFDSVPTGAEVYIDGVLLGVTPMSASVKRKKGATLTMKKEGYVDRVMPMATTMNMTFLGNLVTGGLFGTTTDSATGAINKYEPGQFMVTLQKK
jgi:hypothetical protein